MLFCELKVNIECHLDFFLHLLLKDVEQLLFETVRIFKIRVFEERTIEVEFFFQLIFKFFLYLCIFSIPPI